MATASKTTDTRDEWRDSPTAWFAALESALRRGDIDAATEARRELSRLGVTVRYRRPNMEAAPCR
jgi:hypothetical protein